MDAEGFDDPLNELDHLVGLVGVKQQIRQILAAHKSAGPGKPGPHPLLIGRSGVGKGMVARALGEIFRNRGLLRKGHLVHGDRANLVAPFIGHTAAKTRAKCEEAIDGVLYVDDAHMLGFEFGLDAIDELAGFIETHGNRLIVVLDTWPREMARFSATAPRLLSHFKPIEFPLYSPEELIGILRVLARRVGYRVPNDLQTTLLPWIENRMRHAADVNGFWRSAWTMLDLLTEAARAETARTGQDGVFAYLPAGWVHAREPARPEVADLEITDFQKAMAAIDK